MSSSSINQYLQSFPPQRRDRCQTWPLRNQRKSKPIKVKAAGDCKFLSAPKCQLVRDYSRFSRAMTKIRQENYSLYQLRLSIVPAIKIIIDSSKTWIKILLRFLWNTICLNYADITEQADIEGSTGLDTDLFHCARAIRFDNYHIRLEDDINGNIMRMPFRYIIAFISIIYIFVSIFFGLTYIVADMIDTQLAYSVWFWLVYSLSTTTCLNSDNLDPNRIHLGVILLANVQAFIAQLLLAFITGIIFSRFARPVSQIEFSDVLVINPTNGVQHIQGRLTPIRPRFVALECQLKLFIQRSYRTQEGEHGVRWTSIPLISDTFPRMSVMIKFEHELNESSPIFQALKNPDENFTVIAYFSGTEACNLNPIHAYKCYNRADIYRNAKFKNMIRDVSKEGGDSELAVNFNALNHLVPFDQKVEISKA